VHPPLRPEHPLHLHLVSTITELRPQKSLIVSEHEPHPIPGKPIPR
jgi:hypothetical protein